MPCDHDISLCEEEFEALTDKQCRAATCKECSAFILQANDKDEVKAFDEHAALQKYHNAHDGWLALDAEDYDITRRNYFTFPTQLLNDAAPSALQSLTTPPWIQPPETSFAHSSATASALKHFQNLFTPPSSTFKERPNKLLNDLCDLLFFQVQAALGYDLETMLPGWKRFLRIWMLRAMNFVTCRCCIQGGSEHRGFHYHDGSELYWQDTGKAAERLGEEMEEGLRIVDGPGGEREGW